ncbi:hypothetical protein RB653_002311 [Dictyostelium firmibasis]|uniref:Transcriptional coactivator p15 (PC4) C-terminal domain-containing protein n=1 Tax=Dictyostelium firmibasis TaxID=79012 RepID=A0AAN7YYM2_9MYCE
MVKTKTSWKKNYKKKFTPKVEDEAEEEVELEEGGSDESGEEKSIKVKKTKTTIASSSSSSSSTNDKSINLSDKRKISYSNFKGLERIDIREYYEDKSGELKPSSKGISLTREQFMTIFENGDKIKDWIKESK